MGIRNPYRSSSMSSRRTTSLPLMGIRNTWRPRTGSASPRSHYPSWGSGTRCNRRDGAHARLHSLPLMGIRNRPCALVHARWVLVLTTPSWGSGTRRQAVLIGQDVDLTTPHGDQEQLAVCRGEPHPRLTTPHGDQERPGRGPARRRARSLTTPHGDQEPVRDAGQSFTPWSARSLPLMGIRNLTTPRSIGVRNRADASSTGGRSLPLMGIRNEVLGAGARGGHLTTPHGDQERSSLPLMGMECAGSSGCPTSSLPLMGIRNVRRCRARGTPASSHYPSWGSGTIPPPPGRSPDGPPTSLPLMGIRNVSPCPGGA